MEMRIAALLLCLAFMPAAAQTVRRSVRATGEGSVSVRPDAARVSVAVVKQAATAADAASQNATAASAVIAAVRQLLGQNADVKTSSYSLIANYSISREGSPAQITGYHRDQCHRGGRRRPDPGRPSYRHGHRRRGEPY